MLFFFNDTATTEIYTLSLHDALPIFPPGRLKIIIAAGSGYCTVLINAVLNIQWSTFEVFDEIGVKTERSEEHTSELQSRQYLVCRLLLEKKKYNILQHILTIITLRSI